MTPIKIQHTFDSKSLKPCTFLHLGRLVGLVGSEIMDVIIGSLNFNGSYVCSQFLLNRLVSYLSSHDHGGAPTNSEDGDVGLG